MPTLDVAWALSWFKDTERSFAYQEARNYYDGLHRKMFAAERFNNEFGKVLGQLRDNLCPAVIDSLTDRLELTGFEAVPETEGLPERAWEVWQRNRMDMRANQVHREALLTGDGFVVVWPDPSGQAAIWPQASHELIVDYSDSDAGVIERAAKLWMDDSQHLRLTVYLPDRTERYRTIDRVSEHSDWSKLEPKRFTAWPGDMDSGGRAVVPNPYGVVPVFHFPNKRHQEPGISELAEVIPLQDVLNKSVADMVVAAEFGAYRQRWATGITPQLGEDGKPLSPFNPGQDTMFASSDPASRFGTFDATPLQQYLDVQDSYRAEIARVSGVPLHYLFISKGDFPSGEAMKSAEARFTRKIRDRQEAFGTIWEQVLRFALAIDESGVPARSRVQVMWESASPRSEREALEVLLLKKALGVSSTQLLIELGYPREQVDEMVAAQVAAAAEANGNGVDDVGAAMVMPTATGRLRIPDVASQARDGTV